MCLGRASPSRVVVWSAREAGPGEGRCSRLRRRLGEGRGEERSPRYGWWSWVVAGGRGCWIEREVGRAEERSRRRLARVGLALELLVRPLLVVVAVAVAVAEMRVAGRVVMAMRACSPWQESMRMLAGEEGTAPASARDRLGCRLCCRNNSWLRVVPRYLFVVAGLDQRNELEAVCLWFGGRVAPLLKGKRAMEAVQLARVNLTGRSECAAVCSNNLS